LAGQIGAMLLFGIIIVRLFYLQVVMGEEYTQTAVDQRSVRTEIPSQRGEILLRDKSTGDYIKMATNTTLDLIYVDPFVTPDKRLVADSLAPLLYTDEDFEACQEEPKFCPEGSVEIIQPEIENEEEYQVPKIIFPTRSEAVDAYADEIYRKINREKIDYLPIKRGVEDEKLDKIQELRLPGIDIIRESSLVYVNPTEVPQSNKKTKQRIAEVLAELLELPKDEVLNKLHEKDLRYVKLKDKIHPEVSEEVRELKRISRQTHQKSKADILAKKLNAQPTPDYFRGVVLVPEHWRYYPDDEIAAQVIGFVNNEGRGQYGVEGKFNRLLSGKKGIIESQKDVSGNAVNPANMSDAINGVSVVLSIDRVVQRFTEKLLAESVQKFKADSGQIIVLEPATGKIIAMANAPLFNPNDFGNAFLLRRTTPEDSREIFKTTPLFMKDEHGRFQPSTFEEFDQQWRLKFDPEFYIFRNKLGPGVFINRTVQEVYEPGSVFKPLIMAAGIETGEVSPTTTFNEDGPVKVGEFTIRTALGEYNGIQTMTNVLETSSNVGMVFVALRLGKSVMHSFIVDKFGFGDHTNINLDEEVPGKVLPKKDWSDALLLTSSFGQGLTTTPIQVVRAWGALANGGILMQPQIVEEFIHPDGRIEKIEPKVLRRVLSSDAATSVTSMLVSAVNNGVAWPARIPGYRVAGKTGTSQIAGPDGKYETGEGAFITSFAGYAPAEAPKFVVYVKFDRPRFGEDNTWGSTTAAPVFKEVMSFLLDYSDIPPDPSLE
jgi:cell division protein FtsI/penicillin-binding protein 2